MRLWETPERNGLGWGKLAGVFHGRQSTFGMGSNMPSRLRSGHARPQGLDSQVDGADGRERAHPRSDGLGHIGALSKSGKSVVWPQVGVRAGRYAVRPRGFCPHLYLNKTCFNGLYRVNNAGEFNSPFGNYRNPNIVNAPVLRAVSAYFNTADISMTTVDYEDVLKTLPKGAFVYLDPPYDPVSETSSFTGYSKCGFTRADQIRLRKCCDELSVRGIKFMLSNSATGFIMEQYAAYNITVVQAKRAVNAIASKRGDVDEVVVRNYE